MKRVYRPRLNWNDDMRTHVPTMTVIEEAPGSYDSGLLDARGNKLFVSIVHEPIGFVVFRDHDK